MLQSMGSQRAGHNLVTEQQGGISVVKSEFLEQIFGSVLPTLSLRAFWVNAIFANWIFAQLM